MKRILLVGLLLVAILLSACTSSDPAATVAEGEVYALQLRSTLWGMQQAVNQAPGTFILQKGDLVAFVWNLKGGWGFAVVNTASQTAVSDFAEVSGGGNFVAPKTMREMVTFLRGVGWENVSPNALPGYVTAALSGGSWLANLASNMTTFLYLPADLVVKSPVLEDYEKAVEGIDT